MKKGSTSSTEEQLRISEKKFSIIFHTSPFPIVLVEMPSSIIVDINPAFLELFEFKKEELVGKTSVELGMHRDLEARKRAFEEFERNGFVRNSESFVQTKSGKPLTISNSMDPIVIDGQKYLLVTLRDVTEQRKTEEALREAVRMREEFLSIASHELKTPLTPLKLQVQILLNQVKNIGLDTLKPEKVLEMAQNIDRHSKRLAILIDGLMDVSRIRTGKMTLRREKVDLSSLFLELIDYFVPQFQAAKCRLQMDVDPNVFVMVDLPRIEEVFSNLINNAIKYAPGAPIHLSVRADEVRGFVRVEVEDHGPGIKKEDRERIFRRFERAGIDQGNITGLGLGLYLAKQIVEAHDGKVFIEAKNTPGSLFVVELPLVNS